MSGLVGTQIVDFLMHRRNSVFQIFRETKEGEIQNLLRAKRELENKLAKLAHGYLPDENDNTSRTGLDASLGRVPVC